MLTQKALKKINTIETRLKLALALKITEQAVIRYISNNHQNLTKHAAMVVIREATGLSDDEILEPTVAMK